MNYLNFELQVNGFTRTSKTAMHTSIKGRFLFLRCGTNGYNLIVYALAHAVSLLCLVQMETEPVVASEPVFSVMPSVQVPCHVPAIPNGSGGQSKAEERSGKMTAEQLAAIEDEELLDKMVLRTRDLKAPLSVMQTVCVLAVNLGDYGRAYLKTS